MERDRKRETGDVVWGSAKLESNWNTEKYLKFLQKLAAKITRLRHSKLFSFSGNINPSQLKIFHSKICSGTHTFRAKRARRQPPIFFVCKKDFWHYVVSGRWGHTCVNKAHCYISILTSEKRLLRKKIDDERRNSIGGGLPFLLKKKLKDASGGGGGGDDGVVGEKQDLLVKPFMKSNPVLYESRATQNDLQWDRPSLRIFSKKRRREKLFRPSSNVRYCKDISLSLLLHLYLYLNFYVSISM